MKREAEERRQAELVKRKERERERKRKEKEEDRKRIAQQEKEQEEEEARRLAFSLQKLYPKVFYYIILVQYSRTGGRRKTRKSGPI